MAQSDIAALGLPLSAGDLHDSLAVAVAAGLRQCVGEASGGLDAAFDSSWGVTSVPALRYRRSGVKWFQDGGTLRKADYTSGAVGSASTVFQLVDASKSWSPGYWAWASIYIVSGTGAGQYRWVAASGSNWLAPDRPFDALDASSVYEVAQLPAAGGLRVDAQGTNLLLYSDDLSTSAWTRSATTVTSGAGSAPEVGESACLVATTTANAQHYVESGAVACSAGQSYTASVFLKSGGLGFAAVALASSAFGGECLVLVDLATGAVVGQDNGTSATVAATRVTAFVGGWWRVAVSAVAAASGSGTVRVYVGTSAAVTAGGQGLPSFAGAGSAGVYVWRAQLEAAPYASSPIRTTSAAFTRARDSVALPLRDLLSAAATVVVDYEAAGFAAAYTGPFCTDNASVGTGELNLFFHATAERADLAKLGGVAVSHPGQPEYHTPYREVLVVDGLAGAVTLYRNGRLSGTASGASFALGAATTANLMGNAGDTANLPGVLRRLRILPRAVDGLTAQLL